MSDIKSSAEIVNPQRVTFYAVDIYDAAAVVDAVRERFASRGSLAPVAEIVPDEPRAAGGITINIIAESDKAPDVESVSAEAAKVIERAFRQSHVRSSHES